MIIENWKPMVGRVALVTGAASGIGRASALAFARLGASVAVVDTNADGGMKTSHLVKEAGSNSFFYPCDVSELDQVERTFEKVIKDYGRVDHAFNNAGIEGVVREFQLYSQKDWNHLIRVNLTGIWNFMKMELIQMRKQGSGSIVNCSSVAGKIGFQNSSAYVASKHGVLGLTKVAALENAHLQIRVNAVCPGIIETPMVNRLVSSRQVDLQQLRESIPMKRLGTPEEVAQAVVWLSSDDAAYITGHSLDVDGGYLSR